jgi:hypothetical protein
MASARSMRLSAPTQVIFLVSLALAIFALIAFLFRIPNVSPHAFWIAIIAMSCWPSVAR